MSKRISLRLLTIISLLFFYLNDFLYLNNVSASFFYISDYIIKSIILILILFSFDNPRDDFLSLFKADVKKMELFLWLIGLIIIGIFIDQKLWRVMYQILPKPAWSVSYPRITNNLHYWFDLTFGLLAVSIVEEFVFRKLIPDQLKIIRSKVLIVILSSLIFGLAHWSFGYHAIITTSLWAVLPIISVLRTGSLLPAVTAHLITNVIAFSGILNQFFN